MLALRCEVSGCMVPETTLDSRACLAAASTNLELSLYPAHVRHVLYTVAWRGRQRSRGAPGADGEIRLFEFGLQRGVVEGGRNVRDTPNQRAFLPQTYTTCSEHSNEPTHVKLGAVCTIWQLETAVQVFGCSRVLATRDHGKPPLLKGSLPLASPRVHNWLLCSHARRSLLNRGQFCGAASGINTDITKANTPLLQPNYGTGVKGIDLENHTTSLKGVMCYLGAGWALRAASLGGKSDAILKPFKSVHFLMDNPVTPNQVDRNSHATGSPSRKLTASSTLDVVIFLYG